MRITVIGTGYVGLVSGTCFAEFGHHVVCVDKDTSKIDQLNQGQIPIYEPGLEKMVLDNKDQGRLFFTNNLAQACEETDAVFIAVGTPQSDDSDKADLKYVRVAAREVAQNLPDTFVAIVLKSTVPVGTGQEIEDIIKKTNVQADFAMVSNPEFLREGAAIEDFMHPDRVVIGTQDSRAREVMDTIYRPLINEGKIMSYMSVTSSELTKYAANAYLATKIMYINEIANLCEACGADVQDVSKGMGLDHRIGSKFLNPGPGYGGSCFPKDTRALVSTAKDYGVDVSIVEHVVKANEDRKIQMAQKIFDILGDVKDKTLGVLGLTFKQNTDDMRDSPSLTILPYLQEKGASIQAYDPKGMGEAEMLLNALSYSQDPYEALEGADAAVILTEWNEFGALDLDRVKENLKTPLVIDLRNLYPLSQMQEAGIHYVSLGRPEV